MYQDPLTYFVNAAISEVNVSQSLHFDAVGISPVLSLMACTPSCQ